jgi:D-apionolactonase
MIAQSYWQLVRGVREPPARARLLHAGPLHAHLDGIDLQNISVGDVEIVRRIYVAVRDRYWTTVPAVVSDLRVEAGRHEFVVTFAVHHDSDEASFSWHGRISGHQDGTLQMSMRGTAGRDMSYNRIGLCVLLPSGDFAGQELLAGTPLGPWTGHLPAEVAPQQVADGIMLPLHPAASRLELGLRSGGHVALDFEGDLFETEDQRNWTDASYKIYSTPASLGIPLTIARGGTVAQCVTVGVSGVRPSDIEPAARLTIGAPSGTRMPEIGLVLSAPAPTAAALAEIAALGPAFLRVDCRLRAPGWQQELAAALQTCSALGVPVELALYCRHESGGLDRFALLLGGHRVARVLVYYDGATTQSPEETTRSALVKLVRDALAPGTTVVGGTDMYFCELNRSRPDPQCSDGLVWTMNPQLHAFDDASVLETPEAQGMQVVTAHRFGQGLPVFVSPITLLPRRTIDGSSPRGDAATADPRQRALLGAAFTVASLKYLAEAGADAVTYFETAGDRGVIMAPPAGPAVRAADACAASSDAASSGAAVSGAADSAAAEVVPLYHPLADGADLTGGEVLSVASTRPREVVALAVRRAGGLTLLLANLTAGRVRVTVTGIDSDATIRRLCAARAARARRDPAGFRGAAAPLVAGVIVLEPHETDRIEARG